MPLTSEYREELERWLRQSQAELAEVRAENERLRTVAKAGYHLSSYIAAINWDGRRNTPEYLAELRRMIEAYQATCATLSEVPE